jgi:hypothetical protein
MRFTTWSALTSLLYDPSSPKILPNNVASGMGRAGIEGWSEEAPRPVVSPVVDRKSNWLPSGGFVGLLRLEDSSHTSSLINQQIDMSSKESNAVASSSLHITS